MAEDDPMSDSGEVSVLDRPPGLKIIPKPGTSGNQVEPVLLVALEPSEELLKYVAQRFKNPYYLVTVSYIEDVDQYSTGDPDRRYHSGTCQVFKMGTNQQATYATFTRAGINRIHACVIDIRDKQDSKRVNHLKERGGAVDYYEGTIDYWSPQKCGENHVDVDVDPTLFAPERSGWRRAVVEHIFDKRPFDECKNRGLVFVATCAEIPLQLATLPIRLLMLPFLWLMLTYNIAYKEFFALDVRDMYYCSGGSAWVESRDGTQRLKQPGLWKILPFISPAALATYALFVFGLPGAIFGIINIKATHGEKIATWGYWETVSSVWQVLGTGIVIVGIVVGLYRMVSYLRRKKTPSSEQVQKRLTELRQHTVAIPITGAVPQTAMSGLWFQTLKRRVCRPYMVK